MFNIESYIENLLGVLKDIFGERLLYLGLQGSYLRNEQHENSDIDIMVIIDNLAPEDLGLYKNALLNVGDYEKSCGFITGKDELSNWNPLEIGNLIHTTKDIYGTLEKYIPVYTKEDGINFIKLSVCNIYHELCHRYIHSDYKKNKDNLPDTLKPVFFILQNLYFIEKEVFYNSKKELLKHLEGEDKEVFSMLLNIQNDSRFDFDTAFSLMFSWCKNTLAKLSSGNK
ncbi:MAG: nucleotidyltransferase domain-containing protein [Lachnospiraceae bacterium]